VKALRCGDQRFEPVVRVAGEGFEVALDGRVYRFTLAEEAPGVWSVRGDDDRGARLHVATDGDTVHLFWEGVVYAVTREREGARSARRHDGGALEAPMPGRVSAVKTTPGARVARGQELVVVEAMKMENALRAPRAGVVRAVHAKVGDMVAPGRALVEIEEEP